MQYRQFLEKYISLMAFLFHVGACIEDKLFPKTNSLLDGRAQPLADIDEFSLKIKVNAFGIVPYFYLTLLLGPLFLILTM